MWEIYSYGGGDFLRMIFSGIAMIFGNNDYMGALQSAALIGFIGVLIYAAFQKGQLDVKWVIGIIMIVMILIVPKVDLIITDRVVPSNSSVVSNIPLGIGGTAAAFSKVGDYITRAFETVFSLPNEVKYTGNGLLFASSLVEASTRFEITTPRISANYMEFWKSCVYYDLLLGRYLWDDLLNSNDLMAFFKSNTSQARAFTYRNTSNVNQIIGCRAGITNQMTKDLDAEVNNATNIYGSRLSNKKESTNNAIARYAAAMPVAYNYLTNMSLTNAQIIGQNALANSIKRGLSNFASEADASAAAQDFAIARAEQERRTTFLVMGKLAKKMLPIMHQIFEAFIYVAFPIVMLLAMLPAAPKVLFGYLKALFWVNMWAPLYAVLHFVMSYYSQGAGSAFPNGLTIMSNTGLGNVINDYVAIAGYLSLSIPMIAWMFVSQSGAMMAGLAGRMMQSYDSPVSKASDEATSGNMQLGNLKYENETSFQSQANAMDSRGGMTVGDARSSTSVDSSGRVYQDYSSSNVPLKLDVSSEVGSTLKESHEKSVTNEESTAFKLAESTSALRQEMEGIETNISRSEGSKQLFGSGENSKYSVAKNETNQLMEKFSEQKGISLENVQAISAVLGGKATLGSNERGMYIKGEVGWQGREISKEDYAEIMSFLSSHQYTSSVANEAQAMRQTLAEFGTGLQDSDKSSFSAALNNQDQATQEHNHAIKNVEQTKRMLEDSEKIASKIGMDSTERFMNWMANEKGMGYDGALNLIASANAGDISSIDRLRKYTHDFVNDELQPIIQGRVDYDKLATNINSGKSNLDNEYSTNTQHIQSEDTRNFQDVKSQSKVASRENIEETNDRTQEINRDRLNEKPNNLPSAMMVPTSIKNDVTEKGKEVEEKVEDMRDSNVFGRTIDKVAGWFD